MKIDRFIASINFRKIVAGVLLLIEARWLSLLRQRIYEDYSGTKWLRQNIITNNIILVIAVILIVYLFVSAFMKQNNKLDLIILLVSLVAMFLVILVNNGSVFLERNTMLVALFTTLGLLHFKLTAKVRKSYIE